MRGQPKTLCVASYNLFKARWFDSGPQGAGGLLSDVRRAPILEADVLALQEAIVGRLSPGGPKRDTVAEIAAALGLDGAHAQTTAPAASRCGRVGSAHHAFAGAAGRERSWGVGLVSRRRARFHSVRLPRPAWSPWRRWALLAEIGPWIVATLHLEVWPLLGTRARRHQIGAFLASLAALDPERVRPVVVAGDFNCGPHAGPHQALASAGFVPALPPGTVTFARAGLRLHLDHVHVRGAAIVNAGVGPASRASDHRPVWVVAEAFPQCRTGA